MSWSGIILVIVGALLLAANFGYLHWSWMLPWWPVLLIAIGVWSLVRPQRGDRHPSQGGEPKP